MIDFHTHVLPGIDDGSRDLDETKALLEEEVNQGVDCVIATPHFYATRTSFHSFLEKRDHAFEQVKLVSPVKLLRAAEVYYFPGMGEAKQVQQLTIEGTDLLMLEMPFAQWTDKVLEEVEKLIYDQRLTVILVHLERFYPFQKDKKIWEEILSLPVIVQLNTGSFLDWREKRFDFRLLKSGRLVLLGSDCHNMKHRLPNLAQGRAVIERKFSTGMLKQLDQYAEQLLKEHTIRL